MKRSSLGALPQLRVRSEYSFRTTYGPLVRLGERLSELGTPLAGLVDTSGTWGHVRWQAALRDSSVAPAFGTEFIIPHEDGRKPRCWVLAEDIKAFYRLSSANPTTEQALAEASGVIRFAGAALEDPAGFDYVDVSPRSITSAQRAVALARKTRRPLVLTSDNDYPGPADRETFLAWNDGQKLTPQHLLSNEELRSAFWFLSKATFQRAVRNTHEVAERLQGIKLPVAPVIQVKGDLRKKVLAGKRYRLSAGHISTWTREYGERLERELAMIAQKDFASYFLVVASLVTWAKDRMLVGPARGSSAGSLVCYLLRITEVDPIPNQLLFERFIDINRDDLPDIDIDFNDQKRPLIFEHLTAKYGAENVARIGSVNTLKPRSVMAHVGKKLAIPHGSTFAVLNVLIEYSSGDSRYGKGLEDTLTTTQPGKDFMARFPEAALMGALEGHASHSGVHAAGVIVSNVPVIEHCTVRDGVAHIDKYDADALGLLKIDALGLRTLGVIEDADCISNEDLYSLKLDDPAVLAIFNQHKFSGIFQFEGAAQRRVSTQVPVESFRQIDHVTALARPGPLGGGATGHYIQRNSGAEPITYRHPSMATYLSDTMGVVLYQEQVMRIVREIGKFSWEDTSTIRKAMSGRKGTEFFDRMGAQFVAGAAELKIPPGQAKEIWDEICSFGAWGMNASHTCSYAVISYWCAYMKCYHPLEYAAACLRNAKDDEQVIEILRELTAEGIRYKAFDADLSAANWSTREGWLLGGYLNLVGVGPVKAAQYIERREAGKLTDKDREKLSSLPVKHRDLRPAHTLWHDIYDNPTQHNILSGPVQEFAHLQDGEVATVVARLTRRERRDQNEAVRLNRRGGELFKGQSLFLDLFVVDDSISKPVLARINVHRWPVWGEPLADRAIDGKDWFLIRGKWTEAYSFMSVLNIKCLTNSEMFR